MAYKDEQGQKDYKQHGDRDYTEEERKQQEARHRTQQAARAANGGASQGNSGRKGLLSRMRDAITGGASNTANKAKKGFRSWKAESSAKGGGGIMSKGLGGLIKSIATPKKLAILASVSGIGAFSVFGMFSSYRNDGVTKNDAAIACETEYINFKDRTKIVRRVKQDTVDTFYDIFVRTMGYSEDFLAGMLGCMNAECGLHYSGIEIDWNTEATNPEGNKNNRYDIFYQYAGGGDINDDVMDVNPTTDQVLEAYYNYSDSIGPTWIDLPDKAVSVYTCDNGRFGAGIGLIGWTGNNGVKFITGVDKIYQDYEWYDLPYQCAYILADFKARGTDSMMQNGEWRAQMQTLTKDLFEFTGDVDADGQRLYRYTGNLYNNVRQNATVNADAIPENLIEPFAAAKWYFENYVNGGESDRQKFACIMDRWGGIEEIQGMIAKARVNSRYAADVTTMADLIYMNDVNDQVYDAQNTHICEDGTVVDDVNLGMAALSISWLEKADYKDDEAAYGEYARSPMAPTLINDWNFIEGQDAPGMGDKDAHKIGTYTSGSLKGFDHYSAKDCGETHDLIACTEFYYYSHIVAFPTETNTGFFSSCDRGTGTAVRISGSDDNFPAGGPLHQLEYVLGSNMNNLFGDGPSDRSDQQGGANQKLWKPTGFMRGCDWYSFEGRDNLPSGNIMISWDQMFANGFGSKAWNVANKGDEMNLRFILSGSMTHTHIVTVPGGASVRTYWGMKFLTDQYNGFEDSDSLVRGDLTVKAPDVMQDGADLKAQYAKDAFDATKTFYTAQQEHAGEGNKPIADGGNAALSLVTHRTDTRYNQKTGLPEFHSWEQIFMRMTHDQDDGGSTTPEYDTNMDGYLDNFEDHITQYGKDAKDSTKADTYFTKDWDGAGSSGGLYANVVNTAKWADNGNDEWTNTHMGGNINNYWRYEIAADSEYRTSQLERFGMAAFMCSYANENDANIYQNEENAGASENATGHILGNIYRRMSRIGENSDISGRYYYYNTVVSNDMLQDLVQLYNTEGPSMNVIEDGDNFGPYYDLSKTMPGAASQARSGFIGDRRYGLTMDDITNMLSGWARKDGYHSGEIDERPGFGTDEGLINEFGYAINSDGTFSNRMYKYMTTPLYDLKDTIEGYGYGKKGGNESDHSPNAAEDVYYRIKDDAAYAQELYGISPYLMIKEYNDGDAGTRDRKPAEDDWMSFIDRHYYADAYGNINMYAYANIAMHPSLGVQTSAASYIPSLKTLGTINADEGKGDTSYSRYMFSCYGRLKYTDYIYAQNESDDEYMEKRLFKDDDRDGNGARDDYNRREWILVPYYHTHENKCSHDVRLPNVNYDLKCDWTIDNKPVGPSQDSGKIDTIYYQNENCDDALNTFSLDTNVNLRGKYDVMALGKLSAYKVGSTVLYFDENGAAISADAKPPMHVTCGGYTCSNPEDATASITCDYPGGCSETIEPGGSHNHSCDECLDDSVEHGHSECDNGDECHDHYGCNMLEWMYHNGKRVYMAIQVVDSPKEAFDINDYKIGGKVVCDKANLLQLIGYDAHGYVDDDYIDAANAMARHNSIGAGGLVAQYYNWSQHEYEKFTYEPGYAENFIGYFTIEGDAITADFSKRGETVSSPGTCGKQDLALIESVRNRVGDGKDGEAERGQHVQQDIGFKTGIEGVPYDNLSRDRNTTVDGYGEYLVTGASHDLSPATRSMTYNDVGNAGWLCGEYGDPSLGGSGPDTALGNGELQFGNSLMRYLLGDEHVWHVRIGSQDKDLITGEKDPSLGFDFQYFKEFVDIDEDAMYVDRVTGQATPDEYDELAEQYRDPDTGEYGPEADKLKNKPIPIFDKPESNFAGSFNKPYDAASGKTVLEEIIERYKDPDGDGDDKDKVHGWDDGPNGDYGTWITHASRGDRGMKTEYIVLKDWFGDPYDGDYTSVNMMYMAFEPVMAKDERDVDGDGDTEEPYIYGHSVFGAVKTDSETWYGQGSNSYWRKLIDAYNESLKALR